MLIWTQGERMMNGGMRMGLLGVLNDTGRELLSFAV